MTRALFALLALLAASAAHAGGAPVTLYDGSGVPLGTANNALYVTGGTGGSSNSGGTAAAATSSNGSDGQATSATNQQAIVFPFVFNGSTWDRVRGTGGSLSTFLSAPLPAGSAVIGGVTQSGTWSVGLAAGSALVGKVGIDQTTPGTTNGVVVNSSTLPSGASTSALQSNVQSAPGAQPSAATGVQGVTGGNPVSTSTTNGALETGGNLATILARTPALGAAARAASQPVTLATDQPAIVTTPNACTITQTVVSGTSGTLIAANPSRKSLRFMNIGAAAVTVAPGTSVPTAGQGMVYEANASGAGHQGGSEAFSDPAIATNAFAYAASAASIIAVWECQ